MSAFQGTDSVTHTRIHDPRVRTLARAAWVAVFGLALVAYIIAIPNQLTAFRTLCVAATCVSPSLTPEMAHNLELAGVSIEFYAVFWIILESVLAVPFLVTSFVLFWRRSDDRMALLVAVWMASLPAAIIIGVLEVAQGQPVWQIPESAFWFIFVFLLILFLYLFPDAHFVPRWTRWLPVPILLFLVSIVLIPDAPLNPETTLLLVIAHPTPVALIAFVTIVLLVDMGVGCQIYRYRHVSTPVQRQQTKWVILGTAVSLTGWIILELVSFLLLKGGPSNLRYGLMTFPLSVGFSILLPLTIGFSALHYRLWDVDFIINRSLVYGGVTALMALGFILDVLVFDHVLESLVGTAGTPIALAIYAGVGGLVFQPMRRSLQRRVDRHLYGLNVHLDDLEQSKSQIVNPGTLTGTQIGPYQVLEPIGSGGMGEVYKGFQATLNRQVAIKILPEQLAKHTEFRARFEREAQMVATLKHPNIVNIFDFGEAQGKYYMVMEFIDGQTLSDTIRAAGKLPLGEVQTLVTDIASALDYAHAAGLVHRDVKPSNIILESVTQIPLSAAHSGQEGDVTQIPSHAYRPVLMDFGIAKILGGGTSLTQTGLMGTLDYISPEQITSAKEVDGRADLYSLGVVVYQMLTGELPFPADSPARLVFAHLQQPPPDPRDIVEDLPGSAAKAILKALAKKPEDRFATASEFAAALA
jgi:Protein kinase domain